MKDTASFLEVFVVLLVLSIVLVVLVLLIVLCIVVLLVLILLVVLIHFKRLLLNYMNSRFNHIIPLYPTNIY